MRKVRNQGVQRKERGGFFSSYSDGSTVPNSQQSNLQQIPENKVKIHKPCCEKEDALSKLILLRMLLAFHCHGMKGKQPCQQVSANPAWEHCPVKKVMQNSPTFPHSNSIVSMLKVHKGKRLSQSQFPLLLTQAETDTEERGISSSSQKKLFMANKITTTITAA